MADHADLLDRGRGFPLRKVGWIKDDVVVAEGVILVETHREGESGVEHGGEFGGVFAAAHGEVGFSAAFSAELGGQCADDLAGLMASLDRGGRRECDERNLFAAEGGTDDDHAFTAETGEDLGADFAQGFGSLDGNDGGDVGESVFEDGLGG